VGAIVDDSERKLNIHKDDSVGADSDISHVTFSSSVRPSKNGSTVTGRKVHVGFPGTERGIDRIATRSPSAPHRASNPPELRFHERRFVALARHGARVRKIRSDFA
jgi:hypothetical protein